MEEFVLLVIVCFEFEEKGDVIWDVTWSYKHTNVTTTTTTTFSDQLGRNDI